MKRITILILSFFIATLLSSCVKKIELDTEISMNKDEALSILRDVLQRNRPEKDFLYYKTMYSNNYKLFAFIWIEEGKKKFYVKTGEFYGKKLDVVIFKTAGNYYLKVIGGTITSCYGFTRKLPTIGAYSVKADWNVFDKQGCDQGFKLKFKNLEDAKKASSALKYLLSQQEEEISPYEKAIYELNNQKSKIENKNTTNKCSVEKILKMKEIGLTEEEIKKVCE